MARNLDTSLLRAFVAVADMGGMTAAAGQLHLTQAAISQQIRRLEEQLDARLFDRGNRELNRTAVGDRLYGRAKAMLALNDEIWSSMTRPEFEGEVKFGVPHDIVSLFVPTALRRYDQEWPRVRVTLDCSTTPILLAKLERGELDLILTTETETPKYATRLITSRLVWIGAKDGLAHRHDPVPIALGDGTCAFRPIIKSALEDSGMAWRSVCDSGTMQAAAAMIGADLAIGALLQSTVPPGFSMLQESEGLPSLPPFYINMYKPRIGASDLATELARQIEETVAMSAKMAA